MQTSIWPCDVVGKPIPPDRDALNHLRCFLICPFTPRDRFDDLYALVERVCSEVGNDISCRVECVRADKITSAGIIHSEIWTQIAQADIVVADVSGNIGVSPYGISFGGLPGTPYLFLSYIERIRMGCTTGLRPAGLITDDW